MTGSLISKNGKYYVVVRVTDTTGKLKQKWINTGISTIGNNKRQAKNKMVTILAELENAKISYSTDLLFVEWIWKWMTQKKNEVRLSSYESYEMNIQKHIEPFFKPKKLRLRDVTAQHVQDYYNQKIKEGVAAHSVHKHNVIIRGALQDAFKKYLISSNPADRATLPSKKKFESKFYTIQEANCLLQATQNEPIQPAIIFGLFYGLRRSEVCGLRWKDIDFNANVIRVCNTVVRSKTLIEEEQTKSNASKRSMFIIPQTRAYLLSLLEQQKQQSKILNQPFSYKAHVCVWQDGHPFSPDYISHKFSDILRKNNLPRIRFHELRHTTGSLLLQQGVSVKQIQAYLGHEKISTTLDVYGHLTLEGKQEAAHTIDSSLCFNFSL